MRITEKQLKEIIRKSISKKLDEQAVDYKDILPGADDAFYKYAEKVEKFLLETAEKSEELRVEGRDLMRPDILGGHDSSVKSAERQRYINKYVAALHKMRGNIVNLLDAILREA